MPSYWLCSLEAVESHPVLFNLNVVMSIWIQTQIVTFIAFYHFDITFIDFSLVSSVLGFSALVSDILWIPVIVLLLELNWLVATWWQVWARLYLGFESNFTFSVRYFGHEKQNLGPDILCNWVVFAVEVQRLNT